jgi:hypothetical protein
MFLKNSRYHGIEEVTARDAAGRDVKAVKFRRLPETTGIETVVQGADRLDIMADRRFRDATRYWRIADANSGLEAGDLVKPVGRVIEVPEK